MSNQAINLNLIPDGVPPVARVTQGDIGRVVQFNVYQGQSVYSIPDGTAIEVNGLKPDKKAFVYTENDGYVSWSGNTITLTTSDQMTPVAGDALCEFRLKLNGADIGTLNFILAVQVNPEFDADISETDIPDIISMATEQMQRAEAAAVSASESKESSDVFAKDAEAWAVGQRDGEDVGSEDVTYQNNAKHYSNLASASETAAADSATTANNAKIDAQTAQAAAETAQTGAEVARAATEAISTVSEAWAVGTKDGAPVESTDAQYQNSAKYWSDIASQYAAQFGRAVKWCGSITFENLPTADMQNGDFYDIKDAFTTDARFIEGVGLSEPAGTDVVWSENDGKWNILTPSGVNSFNGRMGAVAPANGDYTPDMVGALPNVDGLDGQYIGFDTNGNPIAKDLESGGHEIVNESDVTMTQRGKLQFVGFEVTDDPTNDATVVNPVAVDAGHDIQDETGTTLAKQPTLKFEQAKGTNDSENNITIITPDLIEFNDTDFNAVNEGDEITKTFYAHIGVNPAIPTWAYGTDEEIIKALQKHYAGEIDLAEYWNIGDERVISLSAMEATGVGESHIAQDVTMVLMNVGGKELVEPIGDVTECVFIVGQKDVLQVGESSELGYMNTSLTNSGGWNACARRTWCNEVYRNAIPESIRGIFKQHKNWTATGGSASANGNVGAYSEDYFAFASEKEVLGETVNASQTAEAVNKQFKYYETPENRIKKILQYPSNRNPATQWWTRSPKLYSVEYNFVYIASNGISSDGNATDTNSIAPFGVI